MHYKFPWTSNSSWPNVFVWILCCHKVICYLDSEKRTFKSCTCLTCAVVNETYGFSELFWRYWSHNMCIIHSPSQLTPPTLNIHTSTHSIHRSNYIWTYVLHQPMSLYFKLSLHKPDVCWWSYVLTYLNSVTCSMHIVAHPPTHPPTP